MGCWNATCFLTKLPILGGEPVKLLLAAPRGRAYQTGCHPNGCWTPVVPPIAGEYDEYGGIENIQPIDQETRKAWHGMKLRSIAKGTQHAEDIDMTDFASHDAGIQAEAIRDILDMAVRGELEIHAADSSEEPTWRPVVIQMAKLGYWQAMVREFKPFTNYDYIRDVTFRISFLGPIRETLRQMGRGQQDVPSRNLERIAIEMSAVERGMELLRLNYGPVAGDGSQSAIESEWQRDWYMSVWMDAEEMARRGQDDEDTAAFTVSYSYDGNYLHIDIDHEDQPTAIPMPKENARRAALEAIVKNVRELLSI